jgi:hypothetical protein
MNVIVPEISLFRQFCRHEDGWTDHYGALRVAAGYAGLALPARYVVQGLWQHGCVAPWEAVTPGAVVFNAPGAHTRPALVGREDEADFLRSNGYAHARAVGLPILYTPPSGLERVPRSLLVMPTHTLIGDRFPDRSAFSRYADEVREFAADFDHVTICIHPSCKRNGLWVTEFAERGFAIVLGAQTNDANALLRIRALCEQFETVTTNGWGSHVAYALAFGAKVAVHGTKPALEEANLLRDLAWSADAGALRLAMAAENGCREREFLQAHLVPPLAAQADLQKGSWLIGASHRLPPVAMKELLGGLVRAVPAAGADLRVRREAARAQAAALIAAGRTGEGSTLLLQCVRAAADVKDARFLVETLGLIAEDLAPHDAARAAYLREQASTLAARLPAPTVAAA